MIAYSHFVGIDIGKFSFFVNIHGQRHVAEYSNDDNGIHAFISQHADILTQSLCILETTGGYEMSLLLALCHARYSVHRANTRKVKHFIRSYGQLSKTDALDAKGLGLYGYERQASLALYEPASDNMIALYELITRRQDLKKMLVSEKNRLQAPTTHLTQSSCVELIDMLDKQVAVIDGSIANLIEQDADLKRRKTVLKSIPGIGEVVANTLVILLPELGTLNRREIASLAGVAPRANDSGRYQGYRATGHGRAGIKPSLFLAAMAARNSNSDLKTYYEGLVNRGKVKKVALTALMRKIIIIANARLKAPTV